MEICSVAAEHFVSSRTEPNRTVRPNFRKKFGRTERSVEHYFVPSCGTINENVKAINLNGNKVDSGRLTKLLRFEGTKKIPVEEVVASFHDRH